MQPAVAAKAPQAIPQPVEIALGEAHGCARLSDATVRCWGRNDLGQLGNGSSSDAPTPVSVAGLTGVTQLAAALDYTCARTNSGTVHCWGSAVVPEAIDKLSKRGSTPTTIALPARAEAIGVGGTHACARLDDGRVACWGDNRGHQLGTDTASPNGVTIVPLLQDVIELTVGYEGACARKKTGEVYCWGEGAMDVVRAANQVDWPTAGAPIEIPTLKDARIFSVGSRACFGMPNGDFKCVRDDGNLVMSLVPELQRVIDLFALAAGRICVRTRSRAIRCWLPSEVEQAKPPTLEIPMAMADFGPDAKFASGTAHTCAIKADHSIWCWGENEYGQLGDGTQDDRSAAVRVQF
ncbi:MAG: hypothetical protein NVSMB1_14370 [Polyangiales bacterium]